MMKRTVKLKEAYSHDVFSASTDEMQESWENSYEVRDLLPDRMLHSGILPPPSRCVVVWMLK